jgi:hypothetical protein
MISRLTNERCGGFSLLELFGSITLLMAGLVAFGGVFLSTTQMTDRNRENNLVTITVRNAVETLEAATFANVTAEFGAGSSKEYFWCQDDGALLFADPGDAEIAGRFYVYNNEQAMPTSFADLSLDADINANLIIDLLPVTNYVILPARVELTVVNASPPRVVTVDLILTEN